MFNFSKPKDESQEWLEVANEVKTLLDSLSEIRAEVAALDATSQAAVEAVQAPQPAPQPQPIPTKLEGQNLVVTAPKPEPTQIAQAPEPTVADRADQKLQKLGEAVVKENEDALAYRSQRKAEILRQEELIEKKVLLAKAAEELRAARKRSEAELANLAVTYQFGAVVDESVESFLDDLEAEFGI